MSSNLRSIVEFHGTQDGHRCGYCKSSDTNFSDGIWAHALTVNDYQDLIDRGWRRSGQYCYKPTMDVVCCPMYTIRCRIQEFKATKSQKKILKRFNKYLSGDIAYNESGDSRKMSTSSSGGCEDVMEEAELFVESNKEPQLLNVEDVSNALTNAAKSIAGGVIKANHSVKVETEEVCTKTTSPKEHKKGAGLDPQKGHCKKAKQLRIERKLEKLKEKGIDISTLENNCKNKEKQIEDFINELPTELKNNLEVKLVRTAPPSAEWLATSKESFEVYVKYQTTVHNDKPGKFSQFKNFLVDSPLLEEYSGSGPECGYGSFHQQYWLNGKLIAVGVIDILPKCVSSVYYFYDPQYMHLTIGTYGALREIEFTRKLSTTCPALKFYYMGYYIHTCPKMRYKGNFYPSDLLCPETYKWFPLKDCVVKLEISKYCRFDSDLDSIDDNMPSESDILYVPVWVSGVVMLYMVYKQKFANKVIEDDEEMMKYARLVGKKTLKSLILVK